MNPELRIHHVAAITAEDTVHYIANGNHPEFWCRTLTITAEGGTTTVVLFSYSADTLAIKEATDD